ncbi:anti-sigma factor domain-containing protein [Glaciecola sp. KUL10]|uniref:anti-sigma factor n=1 Tax=Glaciecola sp. (strain KUL10) TaxID=2161813 RepID=UPI000D7866CE|nr:anti-sigma factor [Glaciecola sp. KUL10]GBL02899.1 hypothetical protein KUL10_01720 [Glaciecola sp. KUL10]
MSSELEQNIIKRYQNDKVIEHLASNYVLGVLSPSVKSRIDRLRLSLDYQMLDKRIIYWESKLSPLDTLTPELDPHLNTWTNIQAQLNIGDQSKLERPNSFSIFHILNGFGFWKISSVFSLMLCALLGFHLLNQEALGPLSYVAVLEDETERPQIVASTYGESKQLVLDIIDLPALEEDQTFELWVVSKTDQQVRSLGEVPRNEKSFKRMLSEAEWRLIKDSLSLKLSVEDEGGSAIGEPSELIVSRGLCIRLESNDKTS